MGIPSVRGNRFFGRFRTERGRPYFADRIFCASGGVDVSGVPTDVLGTLCTAFGCPALIRAGASGSDVVSGDSAAFLRLWPRDVFLCALFRRLLCVSSFMFSFSRLSLCQRDHADWRMSGHRVLHFFFFLSFLLRPSILFLCQSFLICISILYQSIDIYLSIYLSVILLSVCLLLWYRSF